jgi:sister-chromatid-cohesion protein PDS5
MTADEFEFGTTDGRLQFNQSLVTKSLTTPMLCSRLKELHEELSKLDQQLVVKDSLSSVKKELYTLISHKDRYVKILVACCISDILRLYAPDAPFNTSQLKVYRIDLEHIRTIF